MHMAQKQIIMVEGRADKFFQNLKQRQRHGNVNGQLQYLRESTGSSGQNRYVGENDIIF